MQRRVKGELSAHIVLLNLKMKLQIAQNYGELHDAFVGLLDVHYIIILQEPFS